MTILSAQQIRELDQFTIENEPITPIDLMERAASSCVDYLLKNEKLIAGKTIRVFARIRACGITSLYSGFSRPTATIGFSSQFADLNRNVSNSVLETSGGIASITKTVSFSTKTMPICV